MTRRQTFSLIVERIQAKLSAVNRAVIAPDELNDEDDDEGLGDGEWETIAR